VSRQGLRIGAHHADAIVGILPDPVDLLIVESYFASLDLQLGVLQIFLAWLKHHNGHAPASASLSLLWWMFLVFILL